MNPKYCWSSLKSAMKTFTAKLPLNHVESGPETVPQKLISTISTQGHLAPNIYLNYLKIFWLLKNIMYLFL